MDVPTLIVLGAAGGLLRGAVDLYSRFVSWQTVRLDCRQSARQAPRFQEYFDPSTDIVAPVLHTLMGAGAAVLFGTTGQISGEYAALVVGMSAPMLLTQLTRIQTVNEAVTGDRRPAEGAEAHTAIGAPPATSAVVGADGASASDAATSTPPVPLPQTDPRPAPSPSLASPVQQAASTQSPPPPARPLSSSTPRAALAPTQEPIPGALSADRTQRAEPASPGDTPLPGDPTDRTGSGLDGRGAPRWRQGPATGEDVL